VLATPRHNRASKSRTPGSERVGRLGRNYLSGRTQRAYAPLQAVRLNTAFLALGSALGLAAGLDEAVSANHALPSAFAMFRRMLATVRAEPSRFAVAAEDDMQQLEAALTTLVGWYWE
jgi:hypothetical protein